MVYIHEFGEYRNMYKDLKAEEWSNDSGMGKIRLGLNTQKLQHDF